MLKAFKQDNLIYNSNLIYFFNNLNYIYINYLEDHEITTRLFFHIHHLRNMLLGLLKRLLLYQYVDMFFIHMKISYNSPFNIN